MIVVNNNNTTIPVEFTETIISTKLLARFFVIRDGDPRLIFEIEDKISIYDRNNVLLMEGIIETIEAGDYGCIYKGRNNTRLIFNNSLLKTFQFQKNQSLNRVISNLIKDLDIKCIGGSDVMLKSSFILEAGENLADILKELANITDTRITSTAEGDLLILKNSKDIGGISLTEGLEYGGETSSIISREYAHNVSEVMTKVVIMSQSDILEEKFKENIESSYGENKYTSFKTLKYNLSQNENKQFAKNLVNKSKRYTMHYLANIDTRYDYDINTFVSIKDPSLLIDERMRVFSKQEILSKTSYQKIIGLERTYG